jgi:hypothetical protein
MQTLNFPVTPGVIQRNSQSVQGSRVKRHEGSNLGVGGSRHTQLSYKEIMSNHVMKEYRERIEKQVSGIDKLELRNASKEFVKRHELLRDS